MLKRKFYNTLLNWKNTKNQDCLLVKGARQIGKTFLIDYFGRTNYKSYIYINFIELPQAKDIFKGNLSANEIYSRITLIFPKCQFIPHNTLIFLDEIQECPAARAALNFLALDNQYDVIASGSLLGISYKETISIPVGYETQIEMHSLDFEEFLWAIQFLLEHITTAYQHFCNRTPINQMLHNTLLKHLREYCVIGDMPAVVNQFIQTNHYGLVQQAQERILNSYYAVISKYATQTEKLKVKNCYLSIPRQLAKENKKFQFSVVEHNATARKYANSIKWLRNANLVKLCYNIEQPMFPLKHTKNQNFTKCMQQT